MAAVFRQLEDIFGAALARGAEAETEFQQISELAFCPRTVHPALGKEVKARGSFDKASGDYYVDAPVAYQHLVSEGWRQRVQALADGLIAACDSIAKTKLTQKERDRLKALVATARDEVAGSPPDKLVKADPIRIYKDKDGKTQSVSFAASPHNHGEFIEVPPEKASDYAGAAKMESAEPPLAFKLYKTVEDGLAYHEAWFHEGEVIEHFGQCGERGQIREHSAADQKQARTILSNLKKVARAAGFSSIAPSRHAKLVVEWPIDGFGDAADLDFRHMLENEVDQLAGWLGLGHCDGGSCGSDTMEIFLDVVNFEIAKATFEKWLGETWPDRPAKIYRME